MEAEIDRKKFTILGISIWKIFAYFIIYSFFGYVIETLFGIATKGVWECRQSFLYGPFLGIYGVGAVCIILFAQYFKKNNFTLFLGGYVIGSVVEYGISFLTDAILETQWWDYSNYWLNVNGRVCLLYSIFWGLLTIFLVRKVNPYIDTIACKIQAKISTKMLKTITLAITIFLFVDCITTCYAQDIFITRMIVENQIEVKNREEVLAKYNQLYENEWLANIVDTIWDNKKMIRTFPNIKIEDKNKNTIYLDSLLPDIQPYYLKLFEKE